MRVQIKLRGLYMRKVITILLVVFLALSFVGCEKDKSEEVVKNYEDFMRTHEIENSLSSYSYGLPNGVDPTKKGKPANFKEEDISKELVSALHYDLDNVWIDDTSITIEEVKGQYENYSESKTTKSEDGKTTNYEEKNTFKIFDLEITYIYTDDNNKKIRRTITISGEYEDNYKSKSVEVEGNTEDSYTETITCSGLEVDGTSYGNIEYTFEEFENNNVISAWKLTGATVNGKNVDLRLLEASGRF